MIAVADLVMAWREKRRAARYSAFMNRLTLSLVVFAFIAACASQDGLPETPQVDRADGGVEETDPSDEDSSVGGTPTGTESFEQLCGELQEKVCGALGAASCEQDPACAAASLLATYEPQSCEAALQNERTYPSCGYSACDQLVAKVCGAIDGDGACADQSGCAPALRLRERLSVDAGADLLEETLSSCAAALEDGVIFPACDVVGEP